MRTQVIRGREAAIVTSVESEQPALRASCIQKGYDAPGRRLEVLRSVDLEVERGMFLAIVGISGAGKSTLLNILGTLDRPDARARRLGFVFQFHHLLPEFSAEENVMMPLLIAGQRESDARRRAREALAAVGLHDRWEHRPSELSGGEAQRVAVARALAPEPELVLADEPSGNLDERAAIALHELMSSLARSRGQTFVIVTHSDRLASMAGRVMRLEGGRLTPGT